MAASSTKIRHWMEKMRPSLTALDELVQHSKRDSASMKQIALVTMIFLPGTFVASHMAMPMFDWFQANHQGVLSRWYGLYWAFTLQITVLISMYSWYKLKEHDRLAAIEDKEEMDKIDLTLHLDS